MESQVLFDIALTLVATLGGLLLRAYRQQLQDCKAANANLQEQLSDWKIKIADEYVRRGDFTTRNGETLEHLRRIEDKLDRLIERG